MRSGRGRRDARSTGVTGSGLAPAPAAPAAFRGWLDREQGVNERIVNPREHAAIVGKGNDVPAPYRPEDRHRWPLDVVWLPPSEARAYGFAAGRLESALGVRSPRGRLPMFVHPLSRRLYREGVARHGRAPSPLTVTPTSSYRSLLAWDAEHRAAVLKVSLGATIGRVHRRLREAQIARAVLVNEVLETIPAAVCDRHGVDWFPEVAGVAARRGRHGWLLREVPRALRERSDALVPAFSLISRQGERPPLLVELIRASGERPEAFVARRVLAPYVNGLALLLLGEGLQFEGHAQNVMFEVHPERGLTGRIVLRDLCDVSVAVALRAALGKPFPRPRRGFFPTGSGLRFARNVSDHHVNARRPTVQRASDTIDRYGLNSFVWAINHSLARFFPGYSAPAVEHAFLHLWQTAVAGYFGVLPLHRPRRRGRLMGIASDEAFTWVLDRVDWRAVGGRPAALPAKGAEPLLVGERARRRSGRVYLRVETEWGDVYVDGSRPAFFRAAF